MPEANLVCSAQIDMESDCSEPMEIVYFMTEETVKTDGCSPVRSYGVEAQLMQCGNVVDKCRVDDVSCNKDEVLALIGRVAANGVTPVTLRDVIDDWLCQ